MIIVTSLTIMACGRDSTSNQQATTSAPASSSAEPTKTQPAYSSNDGKPFYDFFSWKKQAQVASIDPDASAALDLVNMPAISTRSALDYYGNEAKGYQLKAEEDVEYLVVIESNQLFELNWFRADYSDLSDSQDASIENTKKAYLIAHAIMGDIGGIVVKNMVKKTTNSDKNNSIDYTDHPGIIKADCDHFDCRLVIKKTSF